MFYHFRLFLHNIFLAFLLLSCQDKNLDVTQDTILEHDYYSFPGSGSIQSMDFYGDKVLFVSNLNGDLVCDIYNLCSGNRTSRVILPCGDYVIPHANVTCLGRLSYSQNSFFPVLYVSSWNNGRQAFVYDIIYSDNAYTGSLVQVIDPSMLNDEIIGKGFLDWVVDKEGGYLYSLAYHLKGTSRKSEGNYTHVTKYRLPPLTEKYVLLEDKDIIDFFSVPVMTVSQDKCFNDGHIYVVAGKPNENDLYPNRFFDIDTKTKQMKEYDILISGEPEGLSILNNQLWININSSDKIFYLNKLIN